MKLVLKRNGVNPSVEPEGGQAGASMGDSGSGPRNDALVNPSDFPSQSDL